MEIRRDWEVTSELLERNAFSVRPDQARTEIAMTFSKIRELFMRIRPETDADIPVIRALITQAFTDHPHSDGREAVIVDALRTAGLLTVSLAAEVDGTVVGSVVFSPVTIGPVATWHGLGPLAVLPGRQRGGIGRRLVQAGLDELRTLGSGGCVVMGEPAYYNHFGFRTQAGLVFPGIPPEYFMGLAFDGPMPQGEVAYAAPFYPG